MTKGTTHLQYRHHTDAALDETDPVVVGKRRMDQRGRERSERSATTVQVLAGLADVAVTQFARGVRQVGSLLGRSDLKELFVDGHEELRARGELTLNRYAAAPEPHMETLAKRVVARKSRERA